MNAVFAAIMGIVQGLSEFLPISSSGHLIVGKNCWGWRAISLKALPSPFM